MRLHRQRNRYRAAIWTDGPANITDTRFETNHAKWWGGAINHQVSAMTVTNCTFEGNRASEDWGGAIFTRYSELKVFNTTFRELRWQRGRSDRELGRNLEIVNSAISGNSSNGEGGGIYNAGVLNITNSTISGTGPTQMGTVGHGGGLWNDPAYKVQVLNNTVLAGNVPGRPARKTRTKSMAPWIPPVSQPDRRCRHGGRSCRWGENGNIVGNAGSGTIDITTVLDPHLAYNGGPTPTHALVAGSLALNAGNNGKAVDAEGNPLVYDQRGEGFTRIVNGTVDIGAFEDQTLFVKIDVKPGSDPNSVNLASKGVIAVAIFTTNNSDTSLVNASTVVFAGASAVHGALEDVNGDGDLDMVLHFRVQDTNLADIYYAQLLAEDLKDGVLDSNHQTAAVSLTGRTATDEYFAGFDDVDLFLSGKICETS